MRTRLPVSPAGLFLDMELSDGVHTPSFLSTTLLMAVQDADVTGKIVCDIGCGSGYLGLGLLLRAARHLHAIDLSPQAVASTKETASLNGLSDRATVLEGNLLDPLDEEVDLVIANPPSTARRVQPEGHELSLAVDGGEFGSEVAITIVRAAADKLTARGTLYLPLTSLTDLDSIKIAAREHFSDVAVICTHDIPYQWFTLGIADTIRDMHAEGYGYPVEHHGHPYYRIEILRCGSPGPALDRAGS